jgi:hypothetical protein
MSSWICGAYHVNTLITWAAANGVLFQGQPVAGREQELAQLLHDANCDGVDARYMERNNRDIVFTPTTHAPHLTPVVIAKSCSCLEYQSCDSGELWEQSDAKQLVAAIYKSAVVDYYTLPVFIAMKLTDAESLYDAASKMRGYNEAPWGLENPNANQG